MALLVCLGLAIAAIFAGEAALRLLRLVPEAISERLLSAVSLGFVLIGYGTLVLGLAHQLTLPYALLLIACLGVGGAISLLGKAKEGRERLKEAMARGWQKLSSGSWAWALLFVLLLGGTFITALEPPAGRDFDGLAEHLAQAAYYVRHHCVTPLWHDHHSHFPSNMQMLYSLALLFRAPAATKLLHWLYGLFCLLLVFRIGQRFYGPGAAPWGTLVLATCPMFIWLSGVAYVDLGMMACVLLALLFLLAWQKDGDKADLLRAGLFAGCSMTVKMQGIPFFGLMMLTGAVVRPLGKDSPLAARYGLGLRLQYAALGATLGLIVAAPWYVRSAINTGNPFYPFAYRLFGGKHWSADRALAYQRHQLEFGLGELPPQEEIEALPRWRSFFVGPREPWKWLAAPFGLTFLPWEYEVNLGPLQNLLFTSLGPLWLALLPLGLFLRSRPPAWRLTAWIFLGLWLYWFLSMQLARYLLPMLALWAPGAGYVAYCFHKGGRWAAALLRVALAMHTLLALAIIAFIAGPAVPVVCGWESREAYLTRHLDVYAPSRYIAQHTPPGACIATYGEVRTFYFDRDAFWAEYGHSDLIPYEQINSPQELVERLRALGVTHVLLNLAHLPGFFVSSDKTLRLLRDAITQGLFVPMAEFHRRPGGPPQFLLFALAKEPRG